MRGLPADLCSEKGTRGIVHMETLTWRCRAQKLGWYENQLFTMCPGRGLRPELSAFTTTVTPDTIGPHPSRGISR